MVFACEWLWFVDSVGCCFIVVFILLLSGVVARCGCLGVCLFPVLAACFGCCSVCVVLLGFLVWCCVYWLLVALLTLI